MNAVPAIIWIIGVVSALAVCAITIARSHYHDGENLKVRPVSWAVIGAHFVTFVLVALPYPIYLQHKDTIGAHARALYEKLGWPSAIIAISVIMLELFLMYMQARRAMLAQEARNTAEQQVETATRQEDAVQKYRTTQKDDTVTKDAAEDDDWPSTLV